MNELDVEKLRQIVSRTDKTGNEKVEMLIEFTEQQVKLCNKPAVMQQRELLNAFQEYYQSNKFDDERTFDWNVEKFLEAFNSA